MVKPDPSAQPEPRWFLEARNCTKRFGPFAALDDVSIQVAKGEFICILGPSGCGKTTLLRVIAGLEEQDEGHVFLRGHDITGLPTSKRECGIVFQSYALFPNLTVSESVAYGIRKHGTTKEGRLARVREMLELVGLKDQSRKYPAQLSGGQQQRVALARALAVEPSLLLLDEPLSALDARVRVRLRQEIRDLQKRLGITTVMVTHDQEEALTMADRIVVISKGRIVQCASPHDVYHGPSDPFVADFIGSMNFLHKWRVDCNQVEFGGLVLQVRPDEALKHHGQEVTIAIRPEDIRLIDTHGGTTNVVPVTVESLEFRGAFCRLRVRLDTLVNGESPVLEIDVHSYHIRQLALVEGSKVPIHLPSDRLLLFGQVLQQAIGA